MKGRRFNVIDLLILLVVLVAVAYVVKKVAKPTAPAIAVPVTVTFQSAPTEYYTRDLRLLSRGSLVEAASGGVFYPVGSLRSVAVAPLYVTVPLPNGQLTKSVDPLNRLIMLTISAKAQKSSDGSYLFDNNPLYIGESLVLKAGPLQLGGTIVNIQVR